MPHYKYSFIFLRFFVHLQLVLLSNDQINVGTVLFAQKDAAKKCWNDEQIALLRARLVYQDILPKTTLVDVKNDEFLNALLDYFHLALNKVKRLADGPTQQINLTAMCDVLGGYFRSILIPLTKRAFYSGTINFETTQNTLKFYDRLKLFLHTDGRNWAPPSDALMSRIARESGAGITKIPGNGDSCDKLTYGNNSGFIYIPIPYFDSKRAPTAIAIPFKDNPLRNLEHKNAVNCLANFYATAKKCLEDMHATRDNINTFNRDFEKFLDAEVFPHLSDEKLYPAFGGVFRIKNAINRKNVEKRRNRVMAAPEVPNNQTKKIRKVDFNEQNEFEGDLQDDDEKAPIIVLVCLCVVTALWLCITLYYCAKNRRVKITELSTTDINSEKRGKSSAVKIPDERKRSSIISSKSNVGKPPEERRRSSIKSNTSNVGKNDAKPEVKKIEFVVDEKQKCKRCFVCANGAQPPKVCPKCKKKHCRCVKNIWSTFSTYKITYPRIFPKNKSDREKPPETSSKHECAAFSVKSAPVTPALNPWQSADPSKVTVHHDERKTDEKIFVFGYDFETSSSDDSSFTDESSSSDTL